MFNFVFEEQYRDVAFLKKQRFKFGKLAQFFAH